MFPCEMARYIAVFAPEARKYGRFSGPAASKLGRRRTNLGRGVRIAPGAPNLRQGTTPYAALSAPLNRGRANRDQAEALHLRQRQRTLLLLLSPPVPGYARRLADRERPRHEQH